jgi:hypothetical protein
MRRGVVGDPEPDDVAVVVAFGPRVEQRVRCGVVDAQLGDCAEGAVVGDGMALVGEQAQHPDRQAGWVVAEVEGTTRPA